MGTLLGALLKLQSIEHELAQVRQRLAARQRAATVQEKRVEEQQDQLQALEEQINERRKRADQQELDLRTHEERVNKLRGQLQTAKTNKEYAAILTEINSLKADNAAAEEESLKVLGEIDTLNAEADQVREKVASEQTRLDEARAAGGEEIDRLNQMLQDLQAKRDEAAGHVPDDVLGQFDRIVDRYDGEAMAEIEVHGKKPPHSYICGGCFMTLKAEHANALRVHDEVRTCDSCGRILYIKEG
jgi:predicted  nucleic acid-binding Zn-ribbon protein